VNVLSSVGQDAEQMLAILLAKSFDETLARVIEFKEQRLEFVLSDPVHAFPPFLEHTAARRSAAYPRAVSMHVIAWTIARPFERMLDESRKYFLYIPDRRGAAIAAIDRAN
jgi:hypothetical protein